MSDGWPEPAAVSQARFEHQVSLLARMQYRGVTFTEAVEGTPRGRRVAVTFDDAFASVLERAFPVLDRLGWPATVFAVTEYGTGDRLISWPRLAEWLGSDHADELRALSWHELRQLQAAGWEVGSHTCTHPHLTQLPDAVLRRELLESRLQCEAMLERPCLSIAYPYGDCDRRVIEAADQAGYRAGAALPARLHSSRRMEWPRVGVFNVDRLPRFAAKVLPVSRRLRARHQ